MLKFAIFPPETLDERSRRKAIKMEVVSHDEESVFKRMDLALNNISEWWN